MSKNVFTPDGGPRRTSRVLDVSEGLKRIGEFEAAEMLAGYAALLRDRESAKVGVTEDITRKLGDEYFRLCAEANREPLQAGFWIEQLRMALEAVAPMLAPCSLNDAMNVVEHWALQGNTLSGDDAKRFHALADRIAPMLMADSNHCQCPACVDGIIHDADCAVHNEPAMPTGPCDCSKRASLDAAIFAGNPEPDAWISTVMCVGPDYGKEYYGKLPIQSLNPLYYKHTKLYKVPPPMLAIARVPDSDAFGRGFVRGYEGGLGAAATECRRQAGALDHGGNEYIRYADAIKCAAAIGSLRAPELNEPSGISGRLAGVEVPDGAFVIDRGFQVERGQSIPTVLVGFRIEDWKARDTFASMLAAAPKPEKE